MDEVRGRNGVVKTTDFNKPEASPLGSNSAASTQAMAGTSGVSNPNGAGLSNVDVTDGVSPEELAILEEAAANGDNEAGSLLKALGIVGGVAAGVGGGYLLYQGLKGRQNVRPPPAATAPTSRAPKGGLPSTELPINYLNWEDVPPPQGQVSGPGKPAGYLGQHQGVVAGYPNNPQLTQQGYNPRQVPTTQTQRGVQEDIAYGQKAAQDAKAAKRGAASARKAERLSKAAEAFRRIIR